MAESPKKHGSRKRRKIGLPPGTLPASTAGRKAVLRVIAYGPHGHEEIQLTSVDQFKDLTTSGRWPVVWLDVDSVTDTQTLEAIGTSIGLHRLTLEDVANTYQRSKVEDYGTYIFNVVRAPYRNLSINTKDIETEQVSFILAKGYLITFQEDEKPGDCFGHVRDRIRKGSGSIRDRGPDYLMYCLIDGAIDAYFPLLENLGEQLDLLEDSASITLSPQTMHRLHSIRREYLSLRRAAWPLREGVASLHREQTPLITDTTRVYLRDCYDHTVQIIDLIETGRELGSGLMELNLSIASNRMNEVMKVLTIITTIFIPLSFIAGIYGMNFDTSYKTNMPELHWEYGYIIVLSFMFVIFLFMLLAFWRMGWIFSRKPPEAQKNPPIL